MSSTYGIEEARGRLGDLVTAVQQGTDIILTRNGRPAARLTRYQEVTMHLATVATAGTITDQNRISVDECRDGAVAATPWSAPLTADQIESGQWDAILAAAGWTVTSAWEDHDGYWTADVTKANPAPATTVAELAKQVLVYGDDHGDETRLHALRPDLAALAGAAAWLQAEHNETITFDPMADDIDAHTAPWVQALHDAYLRALRRLADGVTTP